MSDLETMNLSVILQNAEKRPAISVFIDGNEIQKNYLIEDKKGRLSVPDLPKGAYQVTVEAPGFESQTRIVDVGSNKSGETFMLGDADAAYFYRGKVKVPFKEERRMIGFALSPEATSSMVDEKTRTEALDGIASRLGAQIDADMSPSEDSEIKVLGFKKRMSKTAMQEALEEAGKDSMIDQAGMVVVMTNEAISFLTSKATVRFADSVSEEDAKSLVEQAGWTLGKQLRALGNVWRMSTDAVADYDILDGLNKLAEQESVVYAEPVLRSSVVDDAFTPTDYLFPEQWDHQIIGTPNAWEHLRNIDINRTFGSSDVIIAVVDRGVDANHPEFNGTVTSGASKIYQSFDFTDMVANNNTLTSDHGTACASAAAATANNSSAIAGVNEGVAGVAGNTRVLGIRRGGDEQLYSEMYLWAAGLDADSEADDFPAQISPGADIITNSFGFSTGSPISGLMQDTFDALTDQGRADLDTDFLRPWGMYERCFSIAASTLGDDGTTEQKAGYSSFGSVIEFAAPSNQSIPVIHNPNADFGAFTATILGDPNGNTNDPTVGRPTNQTTLSNAENSGATVLNVRAGANNQHTWSNEYAQPCGDRC